MGYDHGPESNSEYELFTKDFTKYEQLIFKTDKIG